MINNTYQIKIQACLKALNQLDFNLESIRSKYGTENFSNTNISKADLFTKALANKFEPAQIEYLNQKCFE